MPRVDISVCMQRLSLSKPTRPPPGRVGRPVKLKANHFKVACKLAKVLYLFRS